jgi:tetratricopeptide (TPR) repeat protein
MQPHMKHINPAGGSANSARRGWRFLLVLGCVAGACLARAQPTNSYPGAVNTLSYVIEAAGQVEYSGSGSTNWQHASVGVQLRPGDRLRTLSQSRAAVQLSDRSVIRLSERTTLEILPPRRGEKRRFGLPWGSLFFFNREKPADVEFDTPLAVGAIRGTEFLLEVAEGKPFMRLALIDGLVALQTSGGEVTLERGQELRLAPGQPPQKTSLVDIPGAIQWALYYPAVLNPDDIKLDTEAGRELTDVLTKYRSGDLLSALAAWPARMSDASPGPGVLHAALALAVGRVTEAEGILGRLPPPSPGAAALRELIATVRGENTAASLVPGRTSSELLAHTYALQARADLAEALAAARQAVELAPRFGFAHARLAELEFSFGNRSRALAALEQGLHWSPRFPPAYALRGFLLLDQGHTGDALAAFDRARDLDAAFGQAWLGRGLCLMRDRQFASALDAFQAAAALEPQRALFRAYLGKAASELGDTASAEKELGLAKRLDPYDPTAWLYAALDLWQHNRLNEALRNLQQSIDLNDQLAPFRSRLLLDGDRSVRSADLAALYEDVGLSDVSRHTAARSVAEDYANFSGHLFLANSYQTMEDIHRFDLRLETPRQSELLMANLLAPPGAGNLSQLLSQQEHLLFFDPRPVGVSSLTEYASRGDWHQAGTVFGTVDGFNYAVDADYLSLNGQRPNNDAQSRQFFLTLKQRVTAYDDAYFQAGWLDSSSGDVARRYDPADAVLGFRAKETQEPTLYAGWHHAWSPGSHTLLLVGRLDDTLSYTNPEPSVLLIRRDSAGIVGFEPPDPFQPFRLNYANDLTLYSIELQQVWQTEKWSLIAGGRLQSGDINTRAQLMQQPLAVGFLVFSNSQDIASHLDRGDIYGYGSWQVFDPLRLVAGVSYDHISYPENIDLPPLSGERTSRDLVSPKAGLLLTPWDRGLVRASYTKSLGGLFFDNSVRLEPTLVGGFNQAFRSLIPESVKGLVPGTEFETAGIGFDQWLPGGTWFGVEGEWLTSHASRIAGAITNSIPIGFIPDSPSGTEDVLDFRERDLSAYAAQLLGNCFSLSARYRLSDATLDERFPEIPPTAPGASLHNHATLHQVSLAANFNHPCGLFAQWESDWYLQCNSGYQPPLADADFWQHNIFVGYRLPRRYAELRLGLLNILNQDYRLNPLNLYAELPRQRTFTVSLRLNF